MTPSHSDPSLPALRAARCAVAFADLVESVRLMADPQADGIDRWRRFVAWARLQAVQSAGGRLVRTDGDALLMEFSTVRAAVMAAGALHRGLAPFNEGWPEHQSLRLRTGIHLDDVWFDEVEAYGAGVNLAKRVTSLAAPAETVLSLSAREALADGFDAELHDMGERWVKHLDEPIRVFRVGTLPGDEQTAAAAEAADLRPMVAIVPFRCVPGGELMDALGTAMADDLIAAISRDPGLRVLSRLSAAALRDATDDFERIRRVTGAAYVMHGTALVRDQRMMLRAELASVVTGEVVWAGNGAAEIEALFAGQDQLIPHLAEQIGRQVQAFELARARKLPMDSLDAYSLYLGAGGLMHSMQQRDFFRARQALEHLAERHPRHAAPHGCLAVWHTLCVAQGWTERREEARARTKSHIARALDLDPGLSIAHAAAANAAEMFDDDSTTALAHAKTALEFDPADPYSWVLLSSAQVTCGQFQLGLRSAQQAITFSPLDPRRYLFESYAARAAFSCGAHAQAAQYARDSLRRNLHHAVSHRMLVGALWEAGQREDARDAARRYVRMFPRATAGGSVDPPGAARRKGRFVQALLDSGVPEQTQG